MEEGRHPHVRLGRLVSWPRELGPPGTFRGARHVIVTQHGVTARARPRQIEVSSMAESHAYDVLVVGGGATGRRAAPRPGAGGACARCSSSGRPGTGTTGRYHGLLHSGGRYVAKDPARGARVHRRRTAILRRIAPASIEDTGGFFVATPDDPDDYVEAFPAACIAAASTARRSRSQEALRREPALNPGIRRVFRLPDGVVEPWQPDRVRTSPTRAPAAATRGLPAGGRRWSATAPGSSRSTFATSAPGA